MLQENLILMEEMVKKCSTDQRFILKEMSSEKIHTLVFFHLHIVRSESPLLTTEEDERKITQT